MRRNIDVRIIKQTSGLAGNKFWCPITFWFLLASCIAPWWIICHQQNLSEWTLSQISLMLSPVGLHALDGSLHKLFLLYWVSDSEFTPLMLWSDGTMLFPQHSVQGPSEFQRCELTFIPIISHFHMLLHFQVPEEALRGSARTLLGKDCSTFSPWGGLARL